MDTTEEGLGSRWVESVERHNHKGKLGPTHSSSTCFMRTETLQASLVTSLLGGGGMGKASPEKSAAKECQVTIKAGKYGPIRCKMSSGREDTAQSS